MLAAHRSMPSWTWSRIGVLRTVRISPPEDGRNRDDSSGGGPTMITRRRALALASGLAILGTAGSASAQDFERTVRIIVPYAPGGTSDTLARIIAPQLSEAIGQTVVVENKPGAAGNIGADAVAKADPDGHTLVLMDVGNLAATPSLFSDLTFDVKKDLAPVGMVMFGPYVLAVNSSVPAKTPKELADYAKANPGKLAVATSGV